MIVLPKEKIKAKVENPRFLILFGKPKAGKTTLVSRLDNNLIIDLEGGSEFLEALAIQARSVTYASFLAAVAEAGVRRCRSIRSPAGRRAAAKRRRRGC